MLRVNISIIELLHAIRFVVVFTFQEREYLFNRKLFHTSSKAGSTHARDTTNLFHYSSPAGKEVRPVSQQSDSLRYPEVYPFSSILINSSKLSFSCNKNLGNSTWVRHWHKTAFKDATAGSTKRERTFAFVLSPLDPFEGV